MAKQDKSEDSYFVNEKLKKTSTSPYTGGSSTDYRYLRLFVTEKDPKKKSNKPLDTNKVHKDPKHFNEFKMQFKNIKEEIDTILNKIESLATKRDISELKNRLDSLITQSEEIPISFKDETQLDRALEYLVKEGIPVEITPSNIIIIPSYSKDLLKKRGLLFEDAKIGYLSSLSEEEADKIRHYNNSVVDRNNLKLAKRYSKKNNV